MEPGSRLPVGDPKKFRAGAFFRDYQTAVAATGKMAEAQRRAISLAFPTADALESVLEAARAFSPDLNANGVVSSWEGVISTNLQISMTSSLAETPEQRRQMLSSAKNIIHLSPTERVNLPLLLAPSFHAATMRGHGLARHEQGGWIQLAERYEVAVSGSCPFEAGPVAIRQQDFLIEATRDGAVLFAAALGRTKAYAVAVEQRYASVRQREDGRIQLDAPDRPSELYEFSLEASVLELTGTRFGECRFVLSPGLSS